MMDPQSVAIGLAALAAIALAIYALVSGRHGLAKALGGLAAGLIVAFGLWRGSRRKQPFPVPTTPIVPPGSEGHAVGDAAQAGMAQAQADDVAARAAMGVDEAAGPTLADDAARIMAEEKAHADRLRQTGKP